MAVTEPLPPQQQPDPLPEYRLLFPDQPPRRPRPPASWKRVWIVGAALGLALATATVATVAARERHATSPAAATTTPGWCGPHGCFTATPTVRAVTEDEWCRDHNCSPSAAPSAAPAISESCEMSAAWEKEGPTELLDGYINNQGSGNIKPEDLKAGCPQYLPLWDKSTDGIGNGSSFAVPAEVKPGTYETTSSDIESCYWERGRNGHIQANNFITASKVKIRVTIGSGDDTFVTRGCGNWIKVR
jgi:hypothetical protein